MKQFWKVYFTFLFVFLYTSALMAQAGFEGKVAMKITSEGESIDMDYLVKGNDVRIEVDAEEKVAMIMQSQNKKMLMIMPSQKMYMEMDLDKALDYQSESNEKESGNIEKTGETKNINGYTCEKWIYRDEGEVTEAWMAKDLGSFFMFQNPMTGGSQPSWQDRIQGEGFFPMLVINKDASGKEQGRMEVKSVEKKSLDSSLFSAPAGYQKLNMPMMDFK
jgi:hypothetical protein